MRLKAIVYANYVLGGGDEGGWAQTQCAAGAVQEIIASYKLWELLVGWPHILTILLVGYSPFTDTVVRGLVLSTDVERPVLSASAAVRAARS